MSAPLDVERWLKLLPPAPSDFHLKAQLKDWIEGRAYTTFALGLSTSDMASRPPTSELAILRAEMAGYGLDREGIVQTGRPGWAEDQAADWFRQVQPTPASVPMHEAMATEDLEAVLTGAEWGPRSGEMRQHLQRAGMPPDECSAQVAWCDVVKYALARVRWDGAFAAKVSSEIAEVMCSNAGAGRPCLIGRVPEGGWTYGQRPPPAQTYEWTAGPAAGAALRACQKRLAEWGVSEADVVSSHPFGNLDPQSDLTMADVRARLTVLHLNFGAPLAEALYTIMEEARWVCAVQAGYGPALSSGFGALFKEAPHASLEELEWRATSRERAGGMAAAEL